MLQFFSTPIINESDQPQKVLFLDFDGTIALPKRKPNGDYDEQENGFIDATLIDPERFDHLVSLAVIADIPLYFVSGRPDIKENYELFESIIKRVGLYTPEVGGFHSDSINFISKRFSNNGEWVVEEVMTKAQVIQQIHKDKYPYLANDSIMFIDDVPEYLDPVTQLGYQTCLANTNNMNHFGIAEKFLIADLVTLKL